MKAEYAEYWSAFDNDGKYSGAVQKVGGNLDWERENQPKFMKWMGLLPHHYFLDLGCGCLRGTLGLVDYLEPGHFFGVDCSATLIAHGKAEAGRNCTNVPVLLVNKDFDLVGLCGRQFDFILSVSLLTHLAPSDVSEYLSGVKAALAPEGILLASIIPGPSCSGNVACTETNKYHLIEMASKAGLRMYELTGDQANPVPGNQIINRVNQPFIGQWVMVAEHEPNLS